MGQKHEGDNMIKRAVCLLLTVFLLFGATAGGSSDTYLHGLVSGNVNWKEGRRFEAGTTKNTMTDWLDG